MIFQIDDFKVNLEDLIFGTNAAVRSTDGIANHQNIQQIILATQNPIWHLAARGIRTATFGNFSMMAVNTVDGALDQVRLTAR